MKFSEELPSLGWAHKVKNWVELGRVGTQIQNSGQIRVGLVALLRTQLTIGFRQICEKIWSSQVFTLHQIQMGDSVLYFVSDNP